MTTGIRLHILTREDCLSLKFGHGLGLSKSSMEHLVGLFRCPLAMGFNPPYALLMAAAHKLTRLPKISPGSESDQPVEIHQLSSDSDSQKSQRPR